MTSRLAAVCLLALTLLAAGCAANSPSVSEAQNTRGPFPMTVTDDAQRPVTLQKEPARIISLASSNTELVYALGLQDKLVAVDDYSDYPPEAKNKQKIGSFSQPNIEKIVSLAPDLVLATNIHVKTVVPELEKRGLTVVVFQPPKLDQVQANLTLLAKMGGNVDAGAKVAAEFQRRVEAITSKTRSLATRPRVFFELSPDLITAGPDTFVDDLITKAGGESIAHDAQGSWPKLSPESVVLKDPEIIILSDHGSEQGGVSVDIVKARPGWDVISAVKSGRIVPLQDVNIVNRPGPRAVDGLDFLARTIHPELFK